jgi:hypothetical protein
MAYLDIFTWRMEHPGRFASSSLQFDDMDVTSFIA